MDKIQKILLVGLIIFVSLIIIWKVGGLSKLLFLAIETSEQYYQIPSFYWYSCEPASVEVPAKEGWQSISIVGSGLISCPFSSEDCSIEISAPTPTEKKCGFLSLGTYHYYVSYVISEKVGGYAQTTQNFQADNGYKSGNMPIKKSQQIEINYFRYCSLDWANIIPGYGSLLRELLKGKATQISGVQYRVWYKPFILWKTAVFGGGKTPYTTVEQGCVFKSSDKSNLIDSIKGLVGIDAGQSSSTNDYQLEPYKTRNFVGPFVSASVENVDFVTYNGKEGYCLSRRIYAIGTVTTNSGTYKIVDVSHNSILKDIVDCCPSEKEPTRRCNSNFQWEKIGGSECSYFNPCAGIEPYPSGKAKELIWYECINGYCVSKTKVVECASDDDCKYSSKGSICDEIIWECSAGKTPPPCGYRCTSDEECLKCGEGLVCKYERCVSVEKCKSDGDCKEGEECKDGICRETNECKSCWQWGLNLFKKEENKCISVKLIEKWYLPESIEKGFAQNTICPFYLMFVVIIGLIIVIIALLLIKVMVDIARKRK